MRRQNAIQKYGKAVVSTFVTDINLSGNHVWNTTNQSMEIVSSSANDTLAGSGAKKVQIEGVVINEDGLFALAKEVVSLNGTTAVALSTQFRDVFRMFITEYGTYPTTSTHAHGTITVRLSGGGQTQCIIGVGTNPNRYYGQSLESRYTVPHIWWDGSEVIAYELKTAIFNVESAKICNIQGWIRPNAHLTDGTAVNRLAHEFVALESTQEIHLDDDDAWIIPSGSDLWGTAYVSSNNAQVSMLFTLIPILK